MALSRPVLRDLIGHRLRQQVIRFAATAAPPAKVKKDDAAVAPADPAPKKMTSLFDDYGTVYVSPYVKDWRPTPKDFKEYPERDLVNFPYIDLKLYPNKVRLGFIPDSWFLAFYNKTGVTGPYLFGWGLVLFLLQKEIVPIDEQLVLLPPMLIIHFLGQKLFGHHIEKFVDEVVEAHYEEFRQYRRDQLADVREHRDYVARATKTFDGLTEILPEVRRENVALQLEATYRERVNQVYKEMKRRVEYLVESELTKRRFEQKHMVDWIVDQVTKSFGANEEKAMLSKCIADLKVLSKNA
jgi:F-type H+-transporting ATPase subunit b